MTEQPSHPHRRRTDVEPNQIGEYFSGHKRYYDQNFEVTVIKIFSGECYVTNQAGEMIVTILGSCVAACIRDPIAGVGGMNHFLLPEGGDGDAATANRYGAHAMEYLINEILKRGGIRSRLEAKLFGGGNVIDNSAMIGDKNARFARQYLKSEGIALAAEDLGGSWPRRVHYFPDTGKVMLRRLQRREDMVVVDRERAYAATLTQKPVEGDIELFG